MPVVTAASNGPEVCSSSICTSVTSVYSTNDDDAASSPNGVSTSVIIAVAVVLSFLILFIITAIAGCRAHNQKSGDIQDVENTEEQSPLQATPAGIPSLENPHLPHHHIHHHHTHELANHSNLNNAATTISTSTAPPPYSP